MEKALSNEKKKQLGKSFLDQIGSKHFCTKDKIDYRKDFIKKEEKQIEQRYAEREPLLITINGSTGNYTNENKISKKQRVLQDQFYQRELSQLLDYIEPLGTEFLL